jgi:hypothetical protein
MISPLYWNTERPCFSLSPTPGDRNSTRLHERLGAFKKLSISASLLQTVKNGLELNLSSLVCFPGLPVRVFGGGQVLHGQPERFEKYDFLVGCSARLGPNEKLTDLSWI